MSTSEEKLNTEKATTNEMEDQQNIQEQILSDTFIMLENLKETLGIRSKTTEIEKAVLKSSKDLAKNVLENARGYSGINDIQKQINKNEKTRTTAQLLLNTLGKKESNNLKEYRKQVDKGNDQDIKAAYNKLKRTEKERVELNNSVEISKAEEKRLKDLKKDFGGVGLLADLFGAIPGVGTIAQDAFKDVTTEAQLAGGKGLSGLKASGKLIGNIAKGLTKAFAPMAVIAFLGKALLEADSQIVGLQKSMALSNAEAVQFKHSLSNAAASSGDISITGTKLLKTFTDLNAQFGFITNFSTDTLVTMTKLTEVVKLSSEAAGSLAGASLVTGGNFEDNYKNALGTSYELQRQSGVQFDLKGILEETGKVTGTVRANLGGSVERMAEAVTEAKLLGASLDQVAKAGGALLDFQSSIKSEMEAELLTGKQLNLEAARYAALTGDQATLAKELKENMGDFTEFTEMNVIQQKALADAMGMSSDEMADILFQQEVQNRSAKELRALGKDELANRLEQKTAQDKFNDSVAKLKDLFVDVMQTLQPILQVFGKIFEIVGAIVKFLKPIQSTLVGAATGAAFGPWGAAAGAVIGAGMDISNATKTGDLISPASGKTQISTKEGGLFELSKNDDVMAGPNIASNSNMSMNIAPLTNEISQLRREMNSLLTTIANKDSSVYMDGNKVGKSLALGSSNMGA